MTTMLDNEPAPEFFNDIAELSKHLLRPGITIEESQKLYNKWASLGTYDQLSEKACYFNAYDKLMAAVLDLFPDRKERRDVTILDVGAGSGLIGQRLRDEGFEKVDAVDPSREMLRTAEQKGVYRRTVCGFFTQEPTASIENGTYDLLVMCGVCGPGAVPVEAFREALRILKPGGYIVNCMRAEYLDTCPEYHERWHPEVSRLTKQGQWRLVSEHRYPNHYFHYQGLRLVYQAL